MPRCNPSFQMETEAQSKTYEKKPKPKPSLKRDFLSYLQNEFVRRCQKNPKYSLRSFARYLGMSSSALSAIVNGGRPLSEKNMQKIGLALGLTLTEIAQFKRTSHGNSKYLRSIEPRNEDYVQISADQFSIISDWIHYAILQLSTTKDFRWNRNWIAKRLDVSATEVVSAIDRLKRVGLIRKIKDSYENISPSFTSDLTPGLSSDAQKQYQEKTLKKAITAIREVPIEFRDHSSITFSVRKQDLERAKEMITNFRRQLCESLQHTKSDEVYQLNMALFPLTRIERKRK